MTIQNYATYINSTGEINNVFVIDDVFPNAIYDLAHNVPSNSTLIQLSIDDDINLLYFPAGVKTLRPTFQSSSTWNHTIGSADGTSQLSFSSSLPSYTQAQILSAPEQVQISGIISITTGTFNLTTTVPGNYVIKFSGFPYFDYVTSLTFVAGNVTYIDVPKASLTLGMKTPTVIRTQHNYISVPKASLTLGMKTPTVIASDTKLISVPKMTNLTISMKTPTITKTENQLVSIPNINLTINSHNPTTLVTHNQFVEVDKFNLLITTYEPIINP